MSRVITNWLRLLPPFFALAAYAQGDLPCKGPLSIAAVKDLIRNAVTEPRIEDLFRRCGVNFTLTDANEKDLTSAGAAPRLLQSVRGSFRTAANPQPTADNLEAKIEVELWSAIKDSKKPEVFEDYLKQYPTGTFVVPARAKLLELRNGPEPVNGAPEQPGSARVAPAKAEEVFPVYHQHGWSWCLGYLHITASGIRFEGKKHSLQWEKSQVKETSIESFPAGPGLCLQVKGSAQKSCVGVFMHINDEDVKSGKRRSALRPEVMQETVFQYWGQPPW